MAWCPFPDRENASRVARALLEDGLIACANVVPGLHSLFRWNGSLHETAEAGMLVKTNAMLLDKAVARLAELHPYDQPAVIGWLCDATTPDTAAWLGGLTG